jgi:hypothetical protein
MHAGDLVADRFEIERVVGSGGMGTVYRARDRRSDDLVAVSSFSRMIRLRLHAFAARRRRLRSSSMIRSCGTSITASPTSGRISRWSGSKARTSRRASRAVHSRATRRSRSPRASRRHSARRTIDASSTATSSRQTSSSKVAKSSTQSCSTSASRAGSTAAPSSRRRASDSAPSRTCRPRPFVERTSIAAPSLRARLRALRVCRREAGVRRPRARRDPRAHPPR